jgi:hypothetical protein
LIDPLLLAKWFLRMMRDIVWLGRANRTYALSLSILFLLLIGLLAVGAQISAPFIYTLF